MKPRAGSCGSRGLSAVFILLLLVTPAGAQNAKQRGSYLRNIELCSGLDHTPADARIGACTALIDAGEDMTQAGLAIAYNNRGNAYATKEDYDRAIRDFDRSIELNPTYSKPFNNRGVAYVRKHQYDGATDAFDRAIKLNPNYGEAFANRAGAYLKRNEYARAVQDYDQAIRLDPNLDGVWSGRC